jgi:hypothetical protein
MKGWRTLLVNIGLAILPVLQATGAADIGLSGLGATVYGAVVAVANIGLRIITTGPIGTKN